MIFWLRHITRERSAWLLLGLSAVFLEVCALMFQHGLGLRPCLMCIYERLVVLGLLGSALIALIEPAKTFWRWSGLILWGLSIYRGLQLSLKHVDYLLNPSPFNSCSFFPDFPAWLPLDVWFFDLFGNVDEFLNDFSSCQQVVLIAFYSTFQHF